MTSHRVGADELNRLEVLESLALLDTGREERFDRIVAQARRIFQVPVAFISLLDVARQWFKSMDGIGIENLSREVSFCDYVIKADRHLIVEDLLTDPVLKNNPLVVNTPKVRFYAGVPLRVKGQPVGTIAVLDSEPRRFDERDLQMLEALGCWAEAELQKGRLSELNDVLETHRARYAALFEGSPLALQVHRLDGSLLEKNDEASSLWNILGLKLDNLLGPESFAGVDLRHYFELAARGEPQFIEPFVHESKGGRKTYLRAKLQPLTSAGQIESVVVSIEDITDTYAFEETQREIVRLAAEREQRWQRSKQDQENFYAILSHEMRNPLTGILGISEMVLRDPSAMTAEMAESLHTCAETLSGLIDDSLDLERIAQGRLALQLEPFSPLALLESLVRVNQPVARAKGLALELECDLSSPYVRGDRRRISQILANLLSNAIKYTANGLVRVQARSEAAGILFEVADSGQGIAPEQLEEVFRPFFQVESRAADSKRGLGLGLSIVKNLVHLMNGTIRVDSKPGQGSTFSVYLPLSPASEPQTAIPFEQKLSYSVLVVDDNPVNQKILALQLRSMGCSATLAGDGVEALEMLRENTYDLVLMDCHMPRMDGFHATREIRANQGLYGNPIILALTASVQAEARDRCLEAGMNAYLKKPIRHQDLKLALQRSLESN